MAMGEMANFFFAITGPFGIMLIRAHKGAALLHANAGANTWRFTLSAANCAASSRRPGKQVISKPSRLLGFRVFLRIFLFPN